MAPLELYLLTFNCARTLIEPSVLAPRLFQALPTGLPPDVIVFSLQEIAPLAYSFLGGAFLLPYYERVIQMVQTATNLWNDQYKVIVAMNVGMTAIMIFARQEIVDNVHWMETAGVGVGLWDMANKGAVGVRIGYDVQEGGSSDQLEMTFVAAHLAPMEDAVRQRNQDWENISRNLIFTRVGGQQRKDDQGKHNGGTDSETEPLLSSNDTLHGLYSPTSHIFLAGDLNYRTHDSSPTLSAHSSYPQPTSDASSPTHYSHLLASDQLTRELRATRTLHGFQELPITFPPTYKYSRQQQRLSVPAYAGDANPPDTTSGQEQERWHWAKHRYPSWCDRILFHSASAGLLKPRIYTSLPVQPTSDHRPVALSVSVPLEPVGTGEEGESKAPFPLNPRWRERREAARRKEVLVGVMAYLALTWEGNTVLAGLVGGALGGWVLLRSLL